MWARAQLQATDGAAAKLSEKRDKQPMAWKSSAVLGGVPANCKATVAGNIHSQRQSMVTNKQHVTIH
jgi:hypothetical protein